MKKPRLKQLLLASLAAVGMIASAPAATITVNTTNNTDFSAGVTNLYLAISLANTNGESANTINFAIPGDGPHYIITPIASASGGALDMNGGYPMITNHNLTIDGYSQAGAVANTNTILGSNTAVLKIVIDSRQARYVGQTDGTHPFEVGGTCMNYSLLTGATFVSNQQGYGTTTASQIGIMSATNVTIKGLCFLLDWYPGFNGITLNSISMAAAPTNVVGGVYTGPFTTSIISPNFGMHISGCWFNLMPDGVTVVDGGNIAVAAQWHRFSGGNPVGQWLPGNNTVGVAKNSANPRAEFNIFMSYLNQMSIDGWNNRVAGNFCNVFPDGLTQYMPDPQRLATATYVPTASFIGSIHSGYQTYGTDGDGVNDAEERNIFGGLNRLSAIASAAINHQQGVYNSKVSGNYFGVGIDGVTRFTNWCSFLRYSDRPLPATNVIVGTDFDGMSDSLEGNVIYNNWPMDFWYTDTVNNPVLNAQGQVQWNTPGAVPETFNPDALGSRNTIAWRGNKMVNTGPLFSPVYTAPNRNASSGYYDWTCVLFSINGGSGAYEPQIVGPMGTGGLASIPNDPGNGLYNSTNYNTVLDASSTTRRLKGTFKPGADSGAGNRWTNYLMDVYIPNNEALTNGLKFQTLTNTMPAGWVVGEICVASNILVDAADDLDTATNAFNVDITRFNIPAGTKLTAVVNYSKVALSNLTQATKNGLQTARFAEPVSISAAPNITITAIVNNGDGTITISWTGGDPVYVVEKSADVAAAVWTTATTTSSTSATLPIDAAYTFFRVR